MSDPVPASKWLQQLQAGEGAAIQHLWEKFADKLLNIAGNRLQGAPFSPIVEGEDVVASVFESIWSASRNGRLRDIRNVDEVLWLLLATTRRKCIDHLRRQNATRRGGGIRPVSLETAGSPILAEVLSYEPDPQFAIALEEQFQKALKQLPDTSLQEIAVQRIEGYSNEEIARNLNLAISTVQRKLKIVRCIFEEAFKDA